MEMCSTLAMLSIQMVRLPNSFANLMAKYPGRWRTLDHVEQWETGRAADSWGNTLKDRHTWHHEPDVETMTLVPTAVHQAAKHTGGASASAAGATPARTPPFATNPL